MTSLLDDFLSAELPIARSGPKGGKPAGRWRAARQTGVMSRRMHDDEVDIDAGLVRRLIASQLPQWASVAIEPFPSTGTVNAIWRLGSEMYVRLPRVAPWASDMEKELQWLPVVTACVSLGVPEPIAVGRPQFGYPYTWAIYRWRDGQAFVPARDDERSAAAVLAQFMEELRRIDTAGAPRSRRDRPLRDRDDEVRAAVDATPDLIDVDAVIAAWDTALQSPAWDGTLVWTHGDLLPPNALTVAGRISAIIDFGNMGIGDPAIDLIAAWTMLGRDGRAVLRTRLDPADGSWVRARGFALHQALMIISYYRDTNPAFVAMAQRTLTQATDPT